MRAQIQRHLGRSDGHNLDRDADWATGGRRHGRWSRVGAPWPEGTAGDIRVAHYGTQKLEPQGREICEVPQHPLGDFPDVVPHRRGRVRLLVDLLRDALALADLLLDHPVAEFDSLDHHIVPGATVRRSVRR